jgi:hypothetical protein
MEILCSIQKQDTKDLMVRKNFYVENVACVLRDRDKGVNGTIEDMLFECDGMHNFFVEP